MLGLNKNAKTIVHTKATLAKPKAILRVSFGVISTGKNPINAAPKNGNRSNTVSIVKVKSDEC
ncbi:hypothetical protein CAL7716_004280 [Calothrix sp. PCC 7716]|nr:hypothetical protein CAL7716_004280 [Calothrix sp. PCC 7716]